MYIFFILGQFLSELERHSEAATQYLRAAELAPKQYDLVLSAATALRQAGQNQQAETLYRKAVALRPEVRYSLILKFFYRLGKILKLKRSSS